MPFPHIISVIPSAGHLEWAMRSPCRCLLCRGNELSLTQQQVAMVLPGGPYTQADLAAITVEASAAASDPSLCELAWEVRQRLWSISSGPVCPVALCCALQVSSSAC